MSNKRITDLTELTTPTTDDVFPVVDIATNTTTKVQLGNLPTTTAVTTALATKQDTLVSGTNIKTVNSTSLLGSGNVAVQETLVSGTNIKTLNSTSLLGSGNITIAANPSGVAGAIQFSNGSAFASDAANLFWDDTNNRLGICTNSPASALNFGVNSYITYNNTSSNSYIGEFGINNALGLQITGNNPIRFLTDSVERMRIFGNGNTAFGSITDLSARVGIKGSGSTSATTSLLVQNSAGTAAVTVTDDLSSAVFGRTQFCVGFSAIPNNNEALRMLVLSSGKSYIDGWTEGASKAQNYAIIFGARANNTGNGISGNTTQENGSQVIFGFDSIPASAQVAVNSTTRGFLPPRMTTTQKNAIASPAAGLVVYDSTTNKLQCYNGSTWNDLF